jgi:hypothetical protein
MDELFADSRPPWPEEIIIEPLRLEIGLWGYPEGDISAAYCADTFPKVKTFRHEGQLFTNMGGSGSSVACYPLLPKAESIGSEPLPHSYEGREVVLTGQRYRLGRKVKFTIRERTLPEGVDYLRRLYAYGGYFAAGKTYAEVLNYCSDGYEVPPWEKAAIDAELTRAELPQTQAEMLAQIAKPQGDGAAPEESRQTRNQLTLSL